MQLVSGVARMSQMSVDIIRTLLRQWHIRNQSPCETRDARAGPDMDIYVKNGVLAGSGRCNEAFNAICLCFPRRFAVPEQPVIPWFRSAELA